MKYIAMPMKIATSPLIIGNTMGRFEGKDFGDAKHVGNGSR
jgi:hypothetical protein